jgi:hypothetical protein
VKSRLHQPPLAQPQLALAGEKAIAGQLADDVEQVALDVVVVIVLQDALHPVGVVDLVEGDVAQPVARDVAVVSRGAHEKAQRIALELQGVAQQRIACRSDNHLAWTGRCLW